MKTEVCITVDIEFGIAGTFVDPARFAPVAAPNVRCNIGGHSHGLGFLLQTFAAHGIVATFFIETLNSLYFGDEPMQSIAHEIAGAGHDVQLHLHPVWTYFRDGDWRERLEQSPPNDSFVGRPQRDQEELITLGLEAFARWGLPRPIALRTGGLFVDPTVYRAMAAQQLPLSSNIGLGIYRPAAATLHLYSGRHRVFDVVEAPVLTYRRSGFGRMFHEKTLTVTGTGWDEMEFLLWSTHRRQGGPVVVLTHPHEYVKTPGRARPNRINQQRLQNLCALLALKRESFETVTFRQRLPVWRNMQDTDNRCLSVPLFRAIKSMAENKLNDWVPIF